MSAVRLVPEPQDEPGKPGKLVQDRAPDIRRHDEDDEVDGSRRLTNIVLAVAVVAVVAIGIWLGDALLEQRRIDDCMARGQRNCGGVSIPAR